MLKMHNLTFRPVSGERNAVRSRNRNQNQKANPFTGTFRIKICCTLSAIPRCRKMLGLNLKDAFKWLLYNRLVTSHSFPFIPISSPLLISHLLDYISSSEATLHPQRLHHPQRPPLTGRGFTSHPLWPYVSFIKPISRP